MTRFARLALYLALIPPCCATALADSEPYMSLEFADAPAQFQPVPRRAGMTRFSMLDAISFEGAAGPTRLVVEIGLPPRAPLDATPVDARVTYRPDGFTDYWQTIGMPRAGEFTFTQLDLSGPRPQIAGEFRVTLCQRASVMVLANTEACRQAVGTFATHLQID